MIKVRHTEQHGERIVRVEYNDSLGEYRCRLFVYGTPRPQADYFTADLEDAIGTARLMARAVDVPQKTEDKEPPPPAPAPEEPKTVPIVPSWEGIVPLLVEVAANGQTAKGRKEAMDELLRLARIVDQRNEQEDVGVRVETRPEVQYLVVFGDPIGGLRFVGPFADRDDAVTYAEFDARPEDWWIAELNQPDGGETA